MFVSHIIYNFTRSHCIGLACRLNRVWGRDASHQGRDPTGMDLPIRSAKISQYVLLDVSEHAGVELRILYRLHPRRGLPMLADETNLEPLHSGDLHRLLRRRGLGLLLQLRVGSGYSASPAENHMALAYVDAKEAGRVGNLCVRLVVSYFLIPLRLWVCTANFHITGHAPARH